jgi:hypothetical protein
MEEVLENNEGYELKEPQSPYNRVLKPKKCSLRLKTSIIGTFLKKYTST